MTDYAEGWDAVFLGKPRSKAKPKRRRRQIVDPDTVARMKALADKPPAHSAPPIPHVSEAMGVHPEQIPDALAYAKANHLPIEGYTPDGRAKFRNHRDFERYCKHEGYFNKR
jgi:hypothetical protein